MQLLFFFLETHPESIDYTDWIGIEMMQKKRVFTHVGIYSPCTEELIDFCSTGLTIRPFDLSYTKHEYLLVDIEKDVLDIWNRVAQFDDVNSEFSDSLLINNVRRTNYWESVQETEWTCSAFVSWVLGMENPKSITTDDLFVNLYSR